jgi:hypothetical protein
VDYLVVSWVVAALAEEEAASLGIYLEDCLTLSDLERCSALPAGISHRDQRALLLALNSRLVSISPRSPRALA